MYVCMYVSMCGRVSRVLMCANATNCIRDCAATLTPTDLSRFTDSYNFSRLFRAVFSACLGLSATDECTGIPLHVSESLLQTMSLTVAATSRLPQLRGQIFTVTFTLGLDRWRRRLFGQH